MHKIPHPLHGFSKLEYSTTCRMTYKYKYTLSESSRRDASNITYFGTATL